MDLQEISKKIRTDILKLKMESQEGHLGSAMSCVEILSVLYFSTLNIDPKKPTDDGRDRFVFSKGHAAAALYAVLAEKGFFPKEKLEEYCKDGSLLAGHATLGSVPGVEATVGALGHGFPMANGMAIAAKRDNKKHRIFALLSDGECDEGTTWESALFAPQHKLDNLTALIDYNKIQAFGRTSEVLNLDPFDKKWESFGWAVKRVDGHDVVALEKALAQVPFEKDKPSVIICDTIKGKGVPAVEDTLASHYKKVSKEEYEELTK